MAYCLLDFDLATKKYTIHDWKNINLLEEPLTTTESSSVIPPCCSHIQKNGQKCKRNAKFVVKNDVYLCKSHAEKADTFLPYDKKNTLAALQKRSVKELAELMTRHSLETENDTAKAGTKAGKVETLHNFFQNRMLRPVVPPSSVSENTKNAKTTNIITLCQNMNSRFMKEFENTHIDVVLIENQISKIATRMYMIQGMVVQYFLLQKGSPARVEFISSRNKLKEFQPVSTEKTEYKNHKKDGILYCTQILNREEQLQPWKCFFENLGGAVKKDDLADCFLQGIWYITHQLIPVTH